jgi:hypothetical protein
VVASCPKQKQQSKSDNNKDYPSNALSYLPIQAAIMAKDFDVAMFSLRVCL